MSMPALEAVRERFPDAHITILARPSVADLFQDAEVCDQVLLYKPEGLVGRWKLARMLRAIVFDLVILLPNSFESALVPFLARIPNRIGYARDGRSLLLTQAIEPPPRDGKRHERFYYLDLLHRAGLIPAVPEEAVVRLRSGSPMNRLHGPVIGISPGAAYGTAKRWHADRFAAAGAELARRLNCGVLVFGAPGEADVCADVAGRLVQQGVEAKSLAGATGLREFVQHAASCLAFLTNDNGAMHVVSALGVPTVAIFGATNHVTTGPAGHRSAVVREKVDCSPYKNPCLLRECPIDHRCMTAVTPERVVMEALKVIG